MAETTGPRRPGFPTRLQAILAGETGVVVELGGVFFGMPIGGSPRIDQPQPAGCSVT
jgi:hypothetical protein